jgi:hypothetical protein
MLTNPIRGKAGKQIVASNSGAAILYTVPAGKYFESPFVPASISITANGVSLTTAGTVIPTPMVLQAGTVVSGAGVVFFGTEYDA